MLLDLFKNLIWSNWVEAAKRELFAAFPILNWGPIGIFMRWLISKYSDKLFELGVTLFNIRDIVISDEKLKKEYDRESVKLKLIATDHGIDSEAFRSAREESKKHLSKFVRFNTAR